MRTGKTENPFPPLVLLILSAVLFLPFLGVTPLFDWDEINFAESAREMLVSGNYFQVQINYEMFHEKPPLFFWMQAACMKIFGIHEWAARMPNVLAGYFTLLLLFYTGKWLKDERTGWILTLLCVCSLLPHFYFRTGIIDPWFNLWIVCGILLYLVHNENPHNIPAAILSGLCIGLGVLTKGPVAILMYGLTLGIASLFQGFRLSLRFLTLSITACALPLIAWYGSLTYLQGWEYLEKFFLYQIELFTQPVAGHEQPWYYHILVLLAGCFPFSWLLFRSGIYISPDYRIRKAKILSLILFFCVLIIFSISKTKIVHYSSLTWIPGILVCGLWIREQMDFPGKIKLPEWQAGIILTGILTGFFLALAGYFLPELNTHPEFIGDKFIRAGLNGPVRWNGLEFLPGLFLGLASLVLFLIQKIKLNQNKDLGKIILIQAAIISIFLNMTAALLAPVISDITQGPAIQFYQQMQKQKCVIITEGYKSYAHYFYAEIPVPDRPELKDKNWLLEGNTDRPIWMVIRVDRMNEDVQKLYHNFREAFRSGGFIFFVRTQHES